MNRKFFVVANPASGRKRISEVLQATTEFLQEKNQEYKVLETTLESRGTTTVKNNLNSSFTDVVIVGGDGTINEVVNGMRFDLPVSIIPAGTGDDYAKALGISKNREELLSRIIDGEILNVDLGICNGRKFVNGVGIGFDGQIVADMLQKTVRFLSGHAKYYYHVLQILSTYKNRDFEVELDGTHIQKKMMAMTIAKGTTFGGGFKLTPHGNLTDGKLAICELGDISPIRRYLNILKLQNGSHDTVRDVELYRAKTVKIKENPLLEGHIDGEYLGKPPFEINVIPEALRVRV